MSEEIVKLTSSDGKEFSVLFSVATQSKTIADLIKDAGSDNPIPLPTVHSKQLMRVVEYCVAHKDDPVTAPVAAATSDVEPIDAKPPMTSADKAFCDELDTESRFALILAANYLDVRGLLELICRSVADQVLGKTPKEIYGMFKIEKELTPEEEEEVRKENPWLEDQ